MKLLALHSFRTSAAIFQQQLTRGRWLNDVFAPGAIELVRWAEPEARFDSWLEGSGRHSPGMRPQHSAQCVHCTLQVFIDAPNPASGKVPRDVAPFFAGPYVSGGACWQRDSSSGTCASAASLLRKRCVQYEWVTVERHGDKLCFDDEKLERSLGVVSDVLRSHAALNRPFDGLVSGRPGWQRCGVLCACRHMARHRLGGQHTARSMDRPPPKT